MVAALVDIAKLHGLPTLNTFITSSPRWLITLTAMRPDLGLSKGREVSLLSVAQASSLISALSVVLSALVGIVRAQEVGVADEEALLVVVGVDEPAGDALGAVAAHLAGVGVEDVDAVDLHLDLAVLLPARMSMSGSPKMTNRLPLPVFFRSSAMCRSAFMRALSTGMRPSLSNSEEWAS